MMAKDIAAAYGVNVSCIYEILHGRSHQSRVMAVVTDDVMARIEAAATAAGVTVEELAARVLTKSVGA
ncbi:MAG: hypothetical protein KF764_11325 [Labilithrix sp.]|nr:hypothetical protein [Labilithrix sp.]